MATQTENGKAFEWAIAIEIHKQTGFQIVIGTATETAKRSFNAISLEKRTHFQRAAQESVKHILEKEAVKLLENQNYKICMVNDFAGQSGDVRDVLIVGDRFQFGISCKTNHDALKHSRLSGDIDFIKKWGLSESGCSQNYWEKAGILFNKLKIIKQESNSQKLWSELEDVPKNYYWPILDAFANELMLLEASAEINQGDFCKNMMNYLIGNQDFYKVIATSKQVEIQAFNFKNTLSIQKSKYPNKIVGIDNLNGGQYSKTVRFSEGYTINFRIHSASSRVEPSLKFDVRAIALPPRTIYTHFIEL
jgi:hypothetical protein